MKQINLRDYYSPYYNYDCFIDVSEEVFNFLKDSKRNEKAYNQRIYYHKAFYSLDFQDYIEKYSWINYQESEEIYNRKALYRALKLLPQKQANRIYAHFVLGVKMSEIAKEEGVGKSAISLSIKRGLHKLFWILKKNV